VGINPLSSDVRTGTDDACRGGGRGGPRTHHYQQIERAKSRGKLGYTLRGEDIEDIATREIRKTSVVPENFFWDM